MCQKYQNTAVNHLLFEHPLVKRRNIPEGQVPESYVVDGIRVREDHPTDAVNLLLRNHTEITTLRIYEDCSVNFRDDVPNFYQTLPDNDSKHCGQRHEGSIAYYISRHCPNLRELDAHTCGADYDLEQEAHIALLLNCPQLETFGMMSLRLDQDLGNCNCSEVLLAGRAFQVQKMTFEANLSKALEMHPGVNFSTWPNLRVLDLTLMEAGQFPYLSKLLKEMPKLEKLNISIEYNDLESSCLFGLKLEGLPQSIKTMSIDSDLDTGVPLVVDQSAAMNALPNLRSLRVNVNFSGQLPLLSKALGAMANLQELTISCGRSYYSEEGEDPNGMGSLTGLCPTNLPTSLRSLILKCNKMTVAPGWFRNILSSNLSHMPLLERISIQFERLECDELGTFSFRMLGMPVQDALPHDLGVFLARHDGIDVELVGNTGTQRVIATHPEYREVRRGRGAITFYLRMHRGAGSFESRLSHFGILTFPRMLPQSISQT